MFTKFLKEEEGAQVIEYALIIAVVSIGLVLALQPGLLGSSISVVVTRISTCLAGTC